MLARGRHIYLSLLNIAKEFGKDENIKSRNTSLICVTFQLRKKLQYLNNVASEKEGERACVRELKYLTLNKTDTF